MSRFSGRKLSSLDQYPWIDVIACKNRKLESDKFINHFPCPECGLSSENLDWIDYCSPERTWKNLCGRQGPLSISPKFNIQVGFIVQTMN